ncbi:MAG: helix-turn-helix domain-containing protein [Pseudomonadota bacterium]
MKIEPLQPGSDLPCPVTHALAVIGGKWKPLLLFVVTNGVNRFGAMQRAIPAITKQMLTQQLRELEADGILHREVFAEVPPRVEYTLTDRGRTLLPVVQTLGDWGRADLAASQGLSEA